MTQSVLDRPVTVETIDPEIETREIEFRAEHWVHARRCVPAGTIDLQNCVFFQAAKDGFPDRIVYRVGWCSLVMSGPNGVETWETDDRRVGELVDWFDGRKTDVRGEPSLPFTATFTHRPSGLPWG